MEFQALDRKLPEEIKKVWRQKSILFLAIVLIVLIGIALCFYAIGIPAWWASFGLVFTLYSFLSIALINFRYNRWRFQISTEKVEIVEGIFFRQRLMIPMVRVQHIEMDQGPFLRKQKLFRLFIHTASAGHQIAAIREEDAESLRHQILELVKVAKEDV